MALLFANEPELITCRGCGCDDDHACVDERGRPCAWVLLDLGSATGVCSTCAIEHDFDQRYLVGVWVLGELPED